MLCVSIFCDINMLEAVEQERSRRETQGVAKCFFDFLNALHCQSVYITVCRHKGTFYIPKIFLNFCTIMYNMSSVFLSSDINTVTRQSECA